MTRLLKTIQVAQQNAVEPDYSISDLRDQFLCHGYKVAEHSKNTMSTRKCHLRFFVEYCERNGISDIRTLNNPIIDNFFIEYGNQPSALTGRLRDKTTLNTARRILKVFLQWIDGYKEGISVRAKPEAIKLVRVRKDNPKAIGDNIISRVIRGIECEQDKLMIATLRESGMRGGEIVEVKVSNLLYNQIQVEAGKDYTDRNVCITLGLANALRDFAEKNNRTGDDWLFQNVYRNMGGQMTEKTVNLRVQRCFQEQAGIHVYIHMLRHTMAVEMLRGGADLVSIQKQLGHKDLNTTQMYLRVYDTFVQDSYAKSMPKSILSY